MARKRSLRKGKRGKQNNQHNIVRASSLVKTIRAAAMYEVSEEHIFNSLQVVEDLLKVR